MRTTRQAVAAVAMSCAALIALASCSSGTSTDTQGGRVTLNMWTWSGAPNETAMKKAIDAYEAANPDVTIKNNVIASDDFKAKVPLALNSGEKIDILGVQPNLFADQIRDNLLPLSDWQKYVPADILSKFTPLSVEQNKKLFTDGQLYSIPFSISGSAVAYYNADLLTEVGVQPPKTWADVAALADVLKTKKPGVAAVVMPSGTDSWFQDEFVLTLVGQSDPNFFNNVRYNKGKWNTPAYVSALTEYQKMFTTGALSKDLVDVNYAKAMELFGSGKAAMVFNGSWESTLLSKSYRDANKIAINDVGAMAVPAIGDPSTRSLRSFLDVTMGIPKNSEHVEAAAKFIAYITAGGGVNQWAQDLGQIPALQGWAAPSGVLATPRASEGFTVIQDLLAKPHGDRNNLSAFSSQAGTRIEPLATGGDPAKAASDMQADLGSGKYS